VLGWRREPGAVEVLRKLLSGRASKVVKRAAIVALGRIGDPSVVDELLGSIDDGHLAGEASTALLLLGEWRGVDEQAQRLASRVRNAPRTLGEIVGRYGGPSYLLLLYRVAEQEDPAGVGALQGLGYLGDPRAVPRLLDQLGSKDRSRQAVANGALELITGHHEDPEESLLRSRWVTWWSHNAPRFKDGLRYRHGQLLDPGQLIERLDHDDAFVRRSTYDELVISTGCRLPFDAEGPYRVQVAHRRAWAQWWQDNAANFPAGRWSFHGELLG
jgi:HEAT repeat protein